MEYDVINAIYAACLVFIIFYVYKIPLSNYLVILGHLALVFLINDFLFPIDYMPDQFKYFKVAALIRENFDFIHYQDYFSSSTVSAASLFFSLFPILIIESVFSIAIINFMLYSFIFIFLYKRNILVGKSKWFYFFFPSLALYAATGLRDILILTFMILSIYYLYKDKLFISIVVATPLVILKPQNFLIFIVAIAIFKSIEKDGFWSVKTFFKSLIALLFLIFLTEYFTIEQINFFRRAMYVEDGGDMALYIPISNYFDFIVQGMMGGVYMVLKPFPWESSNLLQSIQSLENFVIFYIIIKILRAQTYLKNKFINFLIIYFFIAMVIYGLVVFNYGTAARYRFTFETIFIVFSMAIFHKNNIVTRRRLQIKLKER